MNQQISIVQISIHLSKAEKFIHLSLLTIAPIAFLRLPFGARLQPTSCSTSISLPQPLCFIISARRTKQKKLFLYSLENFTRGKLSYISGSQPRKVEKTQWVSIYVYLFMTITAAIHPMLNTFISTRYNLY